MGSTRVPCGHFCFEPPAGAPRLPPLPIVLTSVARQARPQRPPHHGWVKVTGLLPGNVTSTRPTSTGHVREPPPRPLPEDPAGPTPPPNELWPVVDKDYPTFFCLARQQTVWRGASGPPSYWSPAPTARAICIHQP